MVILWLRDSGDFRDYGKAGIRGVITKSDSLWTPNMMGFNSAGYDFSSVNSIQGRLRPVFILKSGIKVKDTGDGNTYNLVSESGN